MAVASDRGSRGSGFSGKDLTVALLRFDNGLVAKIGTNLASVYPHFHRILVYGTGGTFENTPSGDGLFWTSRNPADAPERVTAAYPGVAKGDLVPAFVNAVLGHGEPEVPEAEVFAAVAVCLAIDRAAETGQPVTVDYV
jgi:predicted dehydrogenase